MNNGNTSRRWTCQKDAGHATNETLDMIPTKSWTCYQRDVGHASNVTLDMLRKADTLHPAQKRFKC